MVDVVVVGSLNMDTFIKVEKLPKPGETLHGISIHKFPGGKGANQAIALARLGNSVSMVGKVGNDPDGEKLKQCLNDNGIDASHLSTVNDKPTGSATIVVDRNGNNQIIVFGGANSCVDSEFIEVSKNAFTGTKFLLMQYEIPVYTIEYLIEFASKNHIQVVINPSPYYPIPDSSLRKIDYMILNESEARSMLNTDINTIEQACNSAQQLVQKGIKHVVITLGDQGSVICDRSGTTDCIRPFKVNSVDATGSGDAFIGGFLHGLISHKEFREAVTFANAVGALTVTKMGAQTSLPYRKEVDQFISGLKF